MTTKSTALETEIKANESKLSQFTIAFVAFVLLMLLAIRFHFIEWNQIDRVDNQERKETRTVDDPMRIKVLDIAFAFFFLLLTPFQLIHKRDRKKSSWSIVSSGYETTNRFCFVHVYRYTQVRKKSVHFSLLLLVTHETKQKE